MSNSYKRYRVKDKDENGHEILRYQNLEQNARLLQISDYIISRQPIVTAYGTMFKHHGEEPNPLFTVIQSFLDKRSEYKNTMFIYLCLAISNLLPIIFGYIFNPNKT